jgi:malate dehydrogenase (oxaloacetate-decarboxylating)(NADP+)
MKVAASHALADLAKLPVPAEVLKAYNAKSLEFGRDYIIPKPFDPRAFVQVSAAVAEAAVKSGVARAPYSSKDAYIKDLEERMATSISRFKESK